MISRSIFVLVACGALTGISYFTAKMYSLGFRFNGVTTRLTFLSFLLIPIVFIGSIITTRSAAWGIGPFLYSALQIVSGFGFYLFLGSVVMALFIIGGALTNTIISIYVPITLVTMSLGLGVIGLLQARSITVTSYTVILPNAPESWNGKTAVLVSDTHFGLVNYSKFSDKVVSKILALHPDFVLHAGDFYDGPSIDTAPIVASWKHLTESTPVFYAPGNHEMYGAYQQFIDSAYAAGITVLDDKKTIYQGVQIAGITYRDGKHNEIATQAIDDLSLDNTMPSILINHPPTSLDTISKDGVDLMVSGHTHNGQFWPLNYAARKVYGGYVYGLNTYKDPSSPQAETVTQVLTTRGVGTFGPPFRTFNQSEIVFITFKTN